MVIKMSDNRPKIANDNHPNASKVTLGSKFSDFISRIVPKAKEVNTFGGKIVPKEEDKFADSVNVDTRDATGKMDERVKMESHPNINKTSFPNERNIKNPLKEFEQHPNIDKISLVSGANTTKELKEMGSEKVIGDTVEELAEKKKNEDDDLFLEI